MRRLSVLGPALLLALAVGIGACSAKPAETATQVRLEPVSSAGADPFTPPAGTNVTNVTPPPHVGGTVAGNTVGLFGGTLNQSSCDPGTMVAFLRSHHDRAVAWAGVLGITPDGIAKFVSELTPAILRSDTFVVNHGFANGHATAVPVVLQAGTAVLVDSFGFPVTRCFCGNPLTKPTGFSRVIHVGPQWSSFSTTNITVIQATTVVVNQFTLVEPGTGVSFDRPRGTQGRQDTHVTPPAPSPAPQPSPPASPSPSSAAPSPSASESARPPASWVVGDCHVADGSLHATVLVRNDDAAPHSYQASVGWGPTDTPYATGTATLRDVLPGEIGQATVTAPASPPAPTSGTVPCAIRKLTDETGNQPTAGPPLTFPPEPPTTSEPQTPSPSPEPS